MTEIKIKEYQKPRYVRLRDAEFEAFNAIALEHGMTFAAFVRLLVVREIRRVQKARGVKP